MRVARFYTDDDAHPPRRPIRSRRYLGDDLAIRRVRNGAGDLQGRCADTRLLVVVRVSPRMRWLRLWRRLNMDGRLGSRTSSACLVSLLLVPLGGRLPGRRGCGRLHRRTITMKSGRPLAGRFWDISVRSAISGEYLELLIDQLNDGPNTLPGHDCLKSTRITLTSPAKVCFVFTRSCLRLTSMLTS